LNIIPTRSSLGLLNFVPTYSTTSMFPIPTPFSASLANSTCPLSSRAAYTTQRHETVPPPTPPSCRRIRWSTTLNLRPAVTVSVSAQPAPTGGSGLSDYAAYTTQPHETVPPPTPPSCRRIRWSTTLNLRPAVTVSVPAQPAPTGGSGLLLSPSHTSGTRPHKMGAILYVLLSCPQPPTLYANKPVIPYRYFNATAYYPYFSSFTTSASSSDAISFHFSQLRPVSPCSVHSVFR